MCCGVLHTKLDVTFFSKYVFTVQYILISESDHQCHTAPTVSPVMVASLPTAVLLNHLILMLQAAVVAIVLETNHRSKVSQQQNTEILLVMMLSFQCEWHL